jgi:hypothetical protein
MDNAIYQTLHTTSQFKIYDHALTPTELVLLSGATATANDAPTVNFGTQAL